LVGGAALLCLLTAATCDGPATVKLGDPTSPRVRPGECRLGHSIDNPPPVLINDVLQLADVNNVNDFIQCRVTDIEEHVHRLDPDFIVDVSDSDAVGHGFVADRDGRGGGPGWMFNLSR
jgi:hypothetical protein